MRHPIRGLFFHLSQHIPDNLGIRMVIAPSIAVTTLGSYYGDEAELRPCERVVQVVLEKVVFGQVGDVAGLHRGEQVDV
jgi:hypothetical protein